MIDALTSSYPDQRNDENWRKTLDAALPPERRLGKLAAGQAFDIFCAWLDSGGDDLTHYLTGQLMPEAAVIQFPEATRTIPIRHDLAS